MLQLQKHRTEIIVIQEVRWTGSSTIQMEQSRHDWKLERTYVFVVSEQLQLTIPYFKAISERIDGSIYH